MPEIPSAPKLAARLCLVASLLALPAPAFAAGGGGGGHGGGMGGGMGGGRGGIGGGLGGFGGGQNVRIRGDRGGARGFAAGAPDAVAARAAGDAADRVGPGEARGFAGSGFGPDRVATRRELRRLAERELRIRTSRCDRTIAERNDTPHGCSGPPLSGY